MAVMTGWLAILAADIVKRSSNLSEPRRQTRSAVAVGALQTLTAPCVGVLSTSRPLRAAVAARTSIRRAAKLAGIVCEPKRCANPSRQRREATTWISSRVGERSSQMQAVIAGYNRGECTVSVGAVALLGEGATPCSGGLTKCCGLSLRQACPANQRGTAATTANVNVISRNGLFGSSPAKASKSSIVDRRGKRTPVAG